MAPGVSNMSRDVWHHVTIWMVMWSITSCYLVRWPEYVEHIISNMAVDARW